MKCNSIPDYTNQKLLKLLESQEGNISTITYSKYYTCGKPLEAFPSRLAIKQECLLLLLLFNTILAVLANALWQEKEMRSVNTGKEEINKTAIICRCNCLSKIEKKKIQDKNYLN